MNDTFAAVYWIGFGIVVAIGLIVKRIFSRAPLLVFIGAGILWPALFVGLMFTAASHLWMLRGK